MVGFIISYYGGKLDRYRGIVQYIERNYILYTIYINNRGGLQRPHRRLVGVSKVIGISLSA